MDKIYVVHCWDGTKDDGWYPWLDKKISNDFVKVYRFNMPNTKSPKMDEWISKLKKQVTDLDENTYFVGHSIGCQAIMRYLESVDVKKIGGVLFVAPWLDLLPEAISDDESYRTASPWLNTPIDFNKIRDVVHNITCIFSDDDYFVSLEQERKFKELLNAKTLIVKNKGHISAEDGVEELEEIYDELLLIINKGKSNDYDKFAKKRQMDLISGAKQSHRFVEKPMMKSMRPELSGKKVLMLGCGTGEESLLLESFGAVAKDITGIDLSSNSIKIAKDTYPDINFVIGDMCELPFADESFDFVYSSLAVHYSETPEKVYEEVYRVLKKDGLFLFSVAHPLRWGSIEKDIDGETIRIIGCSKNEDGDTVYGNYHTFEKHIFSSFSKQNDGEILEFYVGSPSMHFKMLRNANFEILDFTESKCVEEAKDVDINYYRKHREIPQFMAFLAKK